MRTRAASITITTTVTMIIPSLLPLLLFLHSPPGCSAAVEPGGEGVIVPDLYSGDRQPLLPGVGLVPTTVPAFPVAQSQNRSLPSCRLDLSAELFGGVADACGRGLGLDRSRCCPVLAAWLLAAHARSALSPSPAGDADAEDSPVRPEEESQRCVAALQASLGERGVELARPNATCDTVLCFCGIRLHTIASLTCPAAFTPSAAAPTAAVHDLERTCRNSSYAGCTRCAHSLQKLKGGGGGGGGLREEMMGRDCELMGLTWLLARNKTAYIPTVSAVLRALLYSASCPSSCSGGGQPKYKCSPDQENMPLAVDSLQFQSQTHLNHHDHTSAAEPPPLLLILLLLLTLPSLLLPWQPS